MSIGLIVVWLGLHTTKAEGTIAIESITDEQINPCRIKAASISRASEAVLSKRLTQPNLRHVLSDNFPLDGKYDFRSGTTAMKSQRTHLSFSSFDESIVLSEERKEEIVAKITCPNTPEVIKAELLRDAKNLFAGIFLRSIDVKGRGEIFGITVILNRNICKRGLCRAHFNVNDPAVDECRYEMSTFISDGAFAGSDFVANEKADYSAICQVYIHGFCF